MLGGIQLTAKLHTARASLAKGGRGRVQPPSRPHTLVMTMLSAVHTHTPEVAWASSSAAAANSAAAVVAAPAAAGGGDEEGEEAGAVVVAAVEGWVRSTNTALESPTLADCAARSATCTRVRSGFSHSALESLASHNAHL